MSSYRNSYIEKLTSELRDKPQILALWEAGSAATGSTDQYSDIDMIALVSCEIDEAFELIESIIPAITHRYIEPVGMRSDLKHRIYFHDDAPKHFFADLGVLSHRSSETIAELMTRERHGNPVVYFDHKRLLEPHPIDNDKWREKLETRVKELEDSLPIYTTQVLKPLDRGQYTEAFAFFYHGLLRRLVELFGIRYRPYRYDFELRYLERDFPKKEQNAIHEYMKYVDPEDLRQKVQLIEQDFRKNIEIIRNQGIPLG